MKLPTWALIVGITMIIFGGCGALNNIQKINTPKAMEQQSDIMSEIRGAIEEDLEEDLREEMMDEEGDGSEIDSADLERVEKVKDTVLTMFEVSDYYKKWIVRLGIIGAIAALFYCIAGILLVMGKRFALQVVYVAIGVSIVSLIFQVIILSLDKETGVISSFSNFGNYFMIFVNIILLVIILASDRSYFYKHEIFEDS